MKTLREVIKEIQEFGEINNAMDLPCFGRSYEVCGDALLLVELENVEPEININANRFYNHNKIDHKGPIVVL